MNVGDYVKTENGISKIVAFYSNAIFNDKNKRIENNLIIKSSPNIIDLIEAGDYVNGREIEELYCCAEYEGLGFDESDDSGQNYILLNEIDIKSIVTKEQFESMEYKVGE